ncbi:MAG: type II toxin-antitoxin system PemK/MazF family toxin [Candidatus Levybacteria bacterium]|nr:type II toxin-antitoxin system PemK/MazF family toxin [Candidatus Levybacteria bacterium]
MKRGDIWSADLRGGTGFEVGKRRPAVIVSKDIIHAISPTVIIVPLSLQAYSILGPERVLIHRKDANLTKDSVALVTQIRAIDKTRLVKKMGSLPREVMQEIEKAIKVILDLQK